jgi:outer membrane protein assembly complex protein YaeT
VTRRSLGPLLCCGLFLALATVPLGAQADQEGLVIRKLKFTGNKSFNKSILAASIATSNSSFFATNGLVRWLGLGVERTLNERTFRVDAVRLKTFYRRKGFLEVRVDTTVVRTERDAEITFHITEGEPVRIRTLLIRGLDSLDRQDRLLRDLALRVGDPYDRDRLLLSADTLIARLQDRGYPEVRLLLEKADVDSAARSADISILMEPGKLSVIGEIHVRGTSEIDSALVASLLATEPGREFTRRDLVESQRQLYRSELFRFATVELDTAHFVPGSGQVPLTIQVQEGPMHRARAAIGYGTNDCFRTGLGWTKRNAMGHGQIFDVSAQVSKLGVGRPTRVGALENSICSALRDDSVGSSRMNYNLTTSFRRPVFLSPSNAIALALFAERRSEFGVYRREELGGSVTLLRESESRTPISATYRLAYGSTEATSVSFCAFFNACTEPDIAQLRERRRVATISLLAQRTRVNNPLDPSRGLAISAELTHSSRLIGSSALTQFSRFIGDAAVYRPVLGSMVAAFHIRAGAVFAPFITLGGSAGNFVPPEHRFYAGGPNDVRGFNRNELGPLVYVTLESQLDEEGRVVEDSVRNAATGGNSLVVANAELRVPSPIFRDQLRLAVFVDAGTVWQRGGEGQGGTPSLRFTPGVGLRVITALGPARLDLAYNPHRLPASRLYVIQNNGDIVLSQENFRRTRNTGRGIVLQFGIGQAF